MQENVELREHYAKERTLLALDRTLLSYIRTSMAGVIVGVSFIKFFESSFMWILGVIVIIVSLLLTVFGIVRSIQKHNSINKYSDEK